MQGTKSDAAVKRERNEMDWSKWKAAKACNLSSQRPMNSLPCLACVSQAVCVGKPVQWQRCSLPAPPAMHAMW